MSIITCDFIDKHIDKPWNWERLNRDILTCEFIHKYIGSEQDQDYFNWDRVINNLTFDFMEKHKQSICQELKTEDQFITLCSNKFLLEKDEMWLCFLRQHCMKSCDGLLIEIVEKICEMPIITDDETINKAKLETYFKKMENLGLITNKW